MRTLPIREDADKALAGFSISNLLQYRNIGLAPQERSHEVRKRITPAFDEFVLRDTLAKKGKHPGVSGGAYTGGTSQRRGRAPSR